MNFQQNGQYPKYLIHGTPHHWDTGELTPYWPGLTFQATHDFVLPTLEDRSSPVVAIYDEASPGPSMTTLVVTHTELSMESYSAILLEVVEEQVDQTTIRIHSTTLLVCRMS